MTNAEIRAALSVGLPPVYPHGDLPPDNSPQNNPRYYLCDELMTPVTGIVCSKRIAHPGECAE